MKSGELIKLIVLFLMFVGPSIAKALAKAQKKQREVRPQIPDAPSYELPTPPPPRRRPTYPQTPRVFEEAAAAPRVSRPHAPLRPTPLLQVGTTAAQLAARHVVEENFRAAASQNPFRRHLAGPEALRRAIILTEVLGPPVSERVQPG